MVDVIYDDNEKCNLLNEYFSSVSSLDDGNSPLPEFDLKTNNTLNHFVISESEIIDIIKIQNPNKATGPDKISHRLLKISPEVIAKPLALILNKSIESHRYPTAW